MSVAACVGAAMTFALLRNSADLAARQSKGLILGRVIDGTTGAPVPGARVHSSAPEFVITDESGQFAMFDVPATNVLISVIKAGYSTSYPYELFYGASSLFNELMDGRRGMSVSVGAGERKTLTIRAWKTATISGRVLDEAGEPVVGVEVFAYPRMLAGGRPWLNTTLAFTGHTDDRGAYRIPELRAGDYVVGVPSTRITGRAIGRVDPITYAPGVTAPSAATAVTIAPGAERSGLDVVLAPTRAYAVAGRVTGPSGSVAGIPIRLVHANDGLADTDVAIGATDGSGRFTLPAVPPGSYRLLAWSFPSKSRGSGMQAVVGSTGVNTRDADAMSAMPALWADVALAVDDRDQTDLVVSVRAGARISGTVRVSEESTAVDLPSLRPELQPVDGRLPQFRADEEIAVDRTGRFQSVGLRPGRYFLRTRPSRVPGQPAYVVQSAMWRGRDLTIDSIDIGADNITDVEITLAPARENVRGTVISDRVDENVVVLFPRAEERWLDFGWRPPNIRTALIGDANRFAIANVPDGDYYIAAVHASVLASWPSPDVMRAISASATRMTVQNSKADVQELHPIVWRPR